MRGREGGRVGGWKGDCDNISQSKFVSYGLILRIVRLGHQIRTAQSRSCYQEYLASYGWLPRLPC